MKRRRSYLLLSLASGALASAALPACSGTDVAPGPSANAGSGSGVFAGSNGPCGGHPCGSVIEPEGGSGGHLLTGSVIEPGDAGAAGEAGGPGAPEIPGEAGASAVGGANGTGGGGPCGGHPCGLQVMPSGGAGGAGGAKP